MSTAHPDPIGGAHEDFPQAAAAAEDVEDREEAAAQDAAQEPAQDQEAEDREGLAAEEAARERAELLESVDRNPGVRQLAANPLLLTILALMKRQGVTLPERRVELYQKYIETLLRQWNLSRGLGRPPSRDLDVVDVIRKMDAMPALTFTFNGGSFGTSMRVPRTPAMILSATFSASAPMTPGNARTNSSPVQRPMQS